MRHRTYRANCKPWKTEAAREMRNNPTASEAALWQRLKGRQVAGFKFWRQAIILGWIADFYCSEAWLVVEIDGSRHDFTQNATRDAAMLSIGIKTLRIPSAEVFKNMPGVVSAIRREAVRSAGVRATAGALPLDLSTDLVAPPPSSANF